MSHNPLTAVPPPGNGCEIVYINRSHFWITWSSSGSHDPHLDHMTLIWITWSTARSHSHGCLDTCIWSTWPMARSHTHGSQHWTLRVILMPTLSSLSVQVVVITLCGTSHDKVGIMTALGFQWYGMEHYDHKYRRCCYNMVQTYGTALYKTTSITAYIDTNVKEHKYK